MPVSYPDKNKPLLIISGPTGAGKSDIALRLALRYGGEIVSADSVAVYKGFDIGSAKPDRYSQGLVKHHLIDILKPDEYFGVDVFVRLAREAIEDIYSRNKLPIVTGGTAFYIQALLYGIDFEDEPIHNDDYRNMLYNEAVDSDGVQKLYEMLKSKDPRYAASVHPNNVKRVVRALEYIHYTGKSFSEYNESQRNRDSEYDFCYTALTFPREYLYDRINRRVDMMMADGLEDEVRRLTDSGYGDTRPMCSIGYKEMTEYISGRCSLDAAVAAIKQNSRHYAKRQLTYLRRERDVRLIELDPIQYDKDPSAEQDNVIDTMIGMING